MAELIDYALAMRKLSENQVREAEKAQRTLKAAGIQKTLEESAILCGAFKREQHDTLAREVAEAWKVQVPTPKIASVRPDQDEDVAVAWRKKGQRKDVEEALRRQEQLKSSGLELPLWEVLEGLGNEDGESKKIELEMAPPPVKSEHDVEYDAPKYVERQDRKEKAVANGRTASPPRGATAVKTATPTARPGLKRPASGRPGSDVQPAVPGPQSRLGMVAVLVGVGCGAIVLTLAAVFLLGGSGGGSDEKTAQRPQAPATAAKPPEQKPPEPKPLPPEAGEVYVLQDRINMCGLWALVEELRGKMDVVKKLQESMELDAKDIEAKVRAAVANGKSIPLGHRIRTDDEITSVNGLQVWADNGKLVEASQSLEKILRGLKAGDQLKVKLRRGGNPLDLIMEFHATPSWPEK